MLFEERLDDARCSMKGRKQTTSSSPGGRSFSSPIHERGQLSRSRQYAEASEDAAAVAARFTLEVFALKIVRAMELITILNHCHRHRGFVYQHARFGPDQKSIEVDVRPREGSKAVCSGCLKRFALSSASLTRFRIRFKSLSFSEYVILSKPILMMNSGGR